MKTDHRTWTLPKAHAGKGPHGIVGGESWVDRGFYRKTAVLCRCGKRYTGWGDTPVHTHTRHVRTETAKATTTN